LPQYRNSIDELSTWLKALESIAILVPPTLPLIFYICIVMSSANLKKKEIFTSNSSCIPIAGKVATFCFDKTGTLYAIVFNENIYFQILRLTFSTKPELDVISAIPILKEETEYSFGAPMKVCILFDASNCFNLAF
jgi:hypothetical protein